MFKGIDTLIFDMDGTLIDSMWMWKDIDVEYLGRFGYSYQEGLQEAIEGLSFSETAVYMKERFNIPDSIDKMMADWNEMARYRYLNEVTLKPGAMTFLKKAKEAGYRTGIGTSNSRELAIGVCEALGIDSLIDCILTGSDVVHGKPEPDIFLGVAERVGASPENCMVFEDIIPGITAARRAGMKVCAVADIYSEDVADRKRELADYFIDDFEGIHCQL